MPFYLQSYAQCAQIMHMQQTSSHKERSKPFFQIKTLFWFLLYVFFFSFRWLHSLLVRFVRFVYLYYFSVWRCLNAFFFSHKIETKAIIKQNWLAKRFVCTIINNSDKSHFDPKKKPSSIDLVEMHFQCLWVYISETSLRWNEIVAIIVKLVLSLK